jgi:type IV pilus assembly protein PilO
MAKTKKARKSNVDFSRFASQFKGLDTSDPSAWPVAPKALLLTGLAVLIVIALWFVWLKGVKEEWDASVAQEDTLKQQYTEKLCKAINLDALLKQREQVQQYVFLLEKQLPGKAEMDALLLDVNQAGVGRSLKFELFKPGAEVTRDYYVELPIDVRVNGRFHDMGEFMADIANLSRIVTLNNVAIEPNKEGDLVLNSMVKTFRYLTAEEQQEQAAKRKAEAKSNAKK